MLSFFESECGYFYWSCRRLHSSAISELELAAERRQRGRQLFQTYLTAKASESDDVGNSPICSSAFLRANVAAAEADGAIIFCC